MQLRRQGWVTKMVILGQLGHYMLPSPPFTLKKKSINWYYTWKSGSSASLICDCVANLPTSTKYIWGFPTVTGRGSMLVHRWLKMHLKKNAWGSYFRSCKLIERPRRLGTFFCFSQVDRSQTHWQKRTLFTFWCWILHYRFAFETVFLHIPRFVVLCLDHLGMKKWKPQKDSMFCSVCGRLRLNSHCSSGAWMSCDHQSEILVLLGLSFSWNWWFLVEDIQNWFFHLFLCQAASSRGKNLHKKSPTFGGKNLEQQKRIFWKFESSDFRLPRKNSCGRPSNCHYCPSRWLSEKETSLAAEHTLWHAQSHSNKQTELEGYQEISRGGASTFCDAKQDNTRVPHGFSKWGLTSECCSGSTHFQRPTVQVQLCGLRNVPDLKAEWNCWKVWGIWLHKYNTNVVSLCAVKKSLQSGQIVCSIWAN